MKNSIKIALGAPRISLCNPEHNSKLYIKEASLAAERGADVIVFPELSLTGKTAADLFFQSALTDSAEKALAEFAQKTAELDIISFIGLPIKNGNKLYNATVAVAQGQILGATASRAYSPHFCRAPEERVEIRLCDRRIMLGKDMIYTPEGSDVKLFVTVGEIDADANKQTELAVAAGANFIINPSAEAEYIGLENIRKEKLLALSKRYNCAAVYVGASDGESGTDGIYSGARLACSCGAPIAVSPLFSEELLLAELQPTKAALSAQTEIFPKKEDRILKFPFIPEGEKQRARACELALEIQSRALAARIERAYAKCVVIGVSGGLDSTLAVLVCERAMRLLGRGAASVIAITMPCFGTSERTKSNALALAEELGATVRTIDIKAAVNQHFSDISHSATDYNVVYENAQARERTQILMDIANACGGLVVGTGDLSELALGFATYNGDQMSMYGVNASVPKTLMRAIIAYAAAEAEKEGKSRLCRVLTDVIETPVSPELLPTTDGEENAQHTESIVGPYELHDFFLYSTVKYGNAPDKTLELALDAFGEEYSEEQLRAYLKIFISRFFSQQFKRSCMPDGPKVTEISLSPRGAWSMPSDVCSALWKKYL